MNGLYGICNTNIFNVSYVLKTKFPKYKTQVLGFEDSVKPKADVILIPTLSLFKQKRKDLEKSKARVFIFDTPVLLDYLTPIELLDAKKTTSFKYNLYELSVDDLRKALAQKEKVVVSSKVVDVIPRLLHSTLPSIMQPILTFLYSVSNTEKRLFYKNTIFNYFSSSKMSLKDLEKSLISISSKGKTKAIENVMEFLSKENAKATKEVVAEAVSIKRKGKAPNVDKLCKEKNISAYDVKYLLKNIEKEKKFVVYPKGKTTEEVYKEHNEKPKKAKN